MSTGKTVLVTGINGYIASCTGLALLQNGYRLRGTSRSAASVSPLVEGAYAAYKSNVELYEVPDMTIPGAYDEAVKGVHAILHMASPIDFSTNDPDKFIRPAVAGALGILDSALKSAGPQLEILVQTSSVAAVYHPVEEKGYVYTEKDWNNFSEEKAKELGAKAPAGMVYQASKARAEKEVWKWVEQKKPSFAVAAVHPGVVYGAPVLLPPSSNKLNETLKPIWQLFSGEINEIPPNIGTGSYVDVHDVARANVFAIENPSKVNGERYILCAGQGVQQAIADILREHYPERREFIPVGEPGVGYNKDYWWQPDSFVVDGRKAEREMGFKYKKLDQTVFETAEALKPLLK